MSSGTAMLRYTLCNRVKSKMSLNLRNRTKRTKVEQVGRKAEAKVNFCSLRKRFLNFHSISGPIAHTRNMPLKVRFFPVTCQMEDSVLL